MARRPRISSAAFRASAERDADPLRNGTTTLEWHNEWQGGVQMNVWEMSTTDNIADCMVRLYGRPARAGLEAYTDHSKPLSILACGRVMKLTPP